MVEELEARVLLSVSHVVRPDYALYRPTGSARPAASAGVVGLTPAQIRGAYGISQIAFGSIVGDGSGQTIAIVDAYNDPTIATDLHTFDVQFGLPDPTLIRINQNGSTTSLPANASKNGWAVEIALDVEWAHAVAPRATILLVEANSASTSDLMTAVNTARRYAGVSVVSMSWGGNESSGESVWDSYFTTPSGHNGVTFLASTGDSGSPGGYPAYSPNVVAVGGTTLTTNSTGGYLGETGWSGSGGGISRYESQPSYQAGVVTQTTTRRAIPDVSAVADPNSGVAVVDSYDFGSTPWLQVGGTSLSAPLWAGLIAIADQGRVLNGLGTLDGRTGTLPALYALPASDFHDITSGSNGYAAGPGYDLVTGRGSPIANLLVPALAGSAVTPTPAIGSLAVSPSSTLAGPNVTLSASGVQELNGTISKVAFYRETNGTVGLQTASDTLLGYGTASGTTWTLSTGTSGFAPGAYTYYAVATDTANRTSAAASTSLTILAPAPTNDLFANATALSGSTATISGSNVGATKESGEPNITTNTGGHSVWYAWTAPSSGTVSLNTHGSAFDTLLGVFTGSSVSALSKVASNDDDPAGGTYTSALTFKAVAGVTYRIAVDGYNGATGSIVLNLSLAAAPSNDLFANARALLSATGLVITATNVGATKESGEPALAGNAGGASVWFTWVAPTSGTVHLNTLGSNFDTMLGVYTGSSVSGLTLVTSNDDSPAGGTLTSAVTFNAVAGTTYRLVVDGYNGAMGSIVMNLT